MAVALGFAWKDWRRSEGGTVVEFAVASVLFFTVVLGILQTSRAFYAYHVVSQAARDGSRYAMVHGSTCTVSGASCSATAAQVQNYVTGKSYPGIDASQMSVSAIFSGYPAGTVCSPNANCTNPGNLVTVKVTYPFLLVVPFVKSTQLTVTSTSAMVIAQ